MASDVVPITEGHDIADVLRLAAGVNSPEQLSDVLREACRVVVELLGVDHSGIVVFSEDGSRGRLVAEHPPHVGTDETGIQVWGIPAETALLQGIGFRYDDVSQAEDLGPVRDTLLQLGVQSILVEPVLCGDKVVASFSVDSITSRRQFSPKEEDICKAFALMLGIAYGKVAQLESERQRAANEQIRTRRIGDFYSAARHLIPELELGALFNEMLRLAAKVFVCKEAHLFLPKSAYGRLDLHASFGVVKEAVTVPLVDDFVGKAARTGELQLLRHASTWALTYNLFSPTARTLAAVPIKVEGTVEAVLVLRDLEIPNGSVSTLDLEIVDRLAQLCSSTLATAFTISPNARTDKLLRALQPILLYLSRCHDFRRITRAFLSGLTAAYGLRFNRAVLLMLDGSRQAFEGKDAIGAVTNAETELAWNSFDRDFDDFGRLVQRLESGIPPPTSTLGELVDPLCQHD